MGKKKHHKSTHLELHVPVFRFKSSKALVFSSRSDKGIPGPQVDDGSCGT